MVSRMPANIVCILSPIHLQWSLLLFDGVECLHTTPVERALSVQKVVLEDEFFLCQIANGSGTDHIKLERWPPHANSYEFDVTDNNDGTYSYELTMVINTLAVSLEIDRGFPIQYTGR